MPRFAGKVGFGIQQEVEQDVWKEVLVERQYYGDLTRNFSRNDNSAKLNDDLTMNNTFSIVADPFAYQNFSNIKYVVYMGVRWKVSSVDASNPPRLILTAGSVYNG